jgi:acyl carrier protein
MDPLPIPQVDQGSLLDAVLAAYRQVLDNHDVNEDDDLFELGGDSIQAMDAIAQIEEATGVQVNAGLFFTYPHGPGANAAYLPCHGILDDITGTSGPAGIPRFGDPAR